MTYMLDTNICIYAMKKKPEKVLNRFREELDGGLCISSITLAELEYGMKHSSDPVKNEQALLRFLAPLSILPFGAGAASEYGEIRLIYRAGEHRSATGYADCRSCTGRGNDTGNEQCTRV